MTLDEAQSLSAGIHRAAKELNTLIYKASAAGLSVGVEVLDKFVVHGGKIPTVQTDVSMPLDGSNPALDIGIGQIGASSVLDVVGLGIHIDEDEVEKIARRVADKVDAEKAAKMKEALEAHYRRQSDASVQACVESIVKDAKARGRI